MVKLGIRLHDMKAGNLKERAKIAREQGFKCIHLALEKTIPNFKMKPITFTSGLAEKVKEDFSSEGIEIAVLGCYKNLANPNPEKVKELQKLYEAHLRMASILGCSVVGTETGAPNEEYKYEPLCHSESSLQTFLRGVEPVIERAEKLGVLFAIEPVWNHIVWNPKVALRVIKEIQSPNLRIILDPVNLLSTENYEDRENVIKEAIELLGEYVEVVHLKDFKLEEGKMVSIAAGTGMMNYKDIMKFIKEDKPYIQATLENTVPENAVQAREYLQGIYDEI